MDSRALYEFLGKPSPTQVEAKIQYAQELRDKAKDPLERDRAVELAKSYIQVSQYLDEMSRLAEAKTVLARSKDAISGLKKALREKERIVLTRTQTEYQIVGQNGEPLDARALSSLQAPKYDGLALARKDKAAWVVFRRELRELNKRMKRWEKVRELAIEVSRIMLDGIALVVEQGKASIEIPLKAREKDYRARVDLIRKGHYTAVNEHGVFFLDGKEIPTFWGIRE